MLNYNEYLVWACGIRGSRGACRYHCILVLCMPVPCMLVSCMPVPCMSGPCAPVPCMPGPCAPGPRMLVPCMLVPHVLVPLLSPSMSVRSTYLSPTTCSSLSRLILLNPPNYLFSKFLINGAKVEANHQFTLNFIIHIQFVNRPRQSRVNRNTNKLKIN